MGASRSASLQRLDLSQVDDGGGEVMVDRGVVFAARFLHPLFSLYLFCHVSLLSFSLLSFPLLSLSSSAGFLPVASCLDPDPLSPPPPLPFTEPCRRRRPLAVPAGAPRHACGGAPSGGRSPWCSETAGSELQLDPGGEVLGGAWMCLIRRGAGWRPPWGGAAPHTFPHPSIYTL